MDSADEAGDVKTANLATQGTKRAGAAAVHAETETNTQSVARAGFASRQDYLNVKHNITCASSCIRTRDAKKLPLGVWAVSLRRCQPPLTCCE